MNARVEIDPALLALVVAASGLSSESAAVEEVLKRFISARRREALDNLYGMGWEGDLEAMREGRLPGEKV